MRNGILFTILIGFVYGLLQGQTDPDSLETPVYESSTVEINEHNASKGLTRLRAVEGAAIYASKKNEVVLVEELTVNLATNNSRQVYAKVPGLNIWESDGAGLQLGIGGRGLSPNRNANFNTRQNGYDISADALGYPESYYTPPLEAIERIEIVRGAASLQYGTQFGGMLNFRFKTGAKDQKMAFRSRQTLGSFGLFNSFNSLGGTVGKVNYYGFAQYKRSNGWRPNSGLEQRTAYASFRIQATPRLRITPEFTHTHYLAQQAGGLTDAEFAQNPRQSKRARNWFKVDWNLFALTLDYKLSTNTTLNSRSFGLIAGRDALGNLNPINQIDFGQERDLLRDQFQNWGNETRLLHRYNVKGLPAALLVGGRYYQGLTQRQQGLGNAGETPDFVYLNPERLEGSDFRLPSRNASFFVENVCYLSPKWTLTPGIRVEYIQTQTDGYYRNLVRDLAGNVLLDQVIPETKSNVRSLVLGGIGLSYKPNNSLEVYGNFSQNYRAINFNDIRVNVGSLVVDPALADERGYNADWGIRGTKADWLTYDVSLFHLAYKGRIGTILKREPNPVFNNLVDRIIRFRTNVADAYIWGVESFAEVELLRLLQVNSSDWGLAVFTNLAMIEARYVNAQENGVEGNAVEQVPPLTFKSGLNASYRALQINFQFSFVAAHFSDASNATWTPTAIEGLIPAYHVMDLSFRYPRKRLALEWGINNLTNEAYFTRRATGYPGPGIIPSEGRSFYLTLEVNL